MIAEGIFSKPVNFLNKNLLIIKFLELLEANPMEINISTSVKGLSDWIEFKAMNYEAPKYLPARTVDDVIKKITTTPLHSGNF